MTYTAADDSWVTTNNAGDQTGFWRYDAYGNLATGTPTSPFGYSGQYTDPATGLINDRARFYEPEDGGFTTRDPAFGQTDTAYTYAGDDPSNKDDPNGQSAINMQGVANWAVANEYGTNNGYGDDCTDFASRALHLGGGDPFNFGPDAPWDYGDAHNWYQYTPEFWAGRVSTVSWAAAKYLALHFLWNGSKWLQSSSEAGPGDIIFANLNGGGISWGVPTTGDISGIDHTGVIVANWHGDPIIVQHSPPQEIPLYSPTYSWTHFKPKLSAWIAVPNPS